MTIDLGAFYRDARLRVTALVSDDLGDTPVPATPLWTLHDVVAHLAGTPEDVRTGNMDGVTSDAWTAAQVERGRDKTVVELLDQWAEDAPAVEGFLSAIDPDDAGTAPLAVVDLLTHEADLRHALGLPADLPDDALAWAADLMLGGFHARVAVAGLPSVSVEASDFEVFRGRLGRRTVDEVCAYDWSADPLPYLDTWFVFGRATASLGETTSAA